MQDKLPNNTVTPPEEAATDTLPETRLSRALDTCLLHLGNAFSWVWVVLMLVIITNVLMRYLLGEGRIEFEELQWHLYALGWLVGLSYCMVTDSHVRVDLLRDKFSPTTKAWIEMLGLIFLLLPFLVLVCWYGLPFVLYSWELGEVSAAPGGLPYRWFMKGALVFAFLLLGFACLSRLSRVFTLLFLSPSRTTQAAVHTSSGHGE